MAKYINRTIRASLAQEQETTDIANHFGLSFTNSQDVSGGNGTYSKMDFKIEVEDNKNGSKLLKLYDSYLAKIKEIEDEKAKKFLNGNMVLYILLTVFTFIIGLAVLWILFTQKKAARIKQLEEQKQSFWDQAQNL